MKILSGIAATTHIDAHNDKMSKECLLSMAEQIRSKFIPLLIEHDPNALIGVQLYAEVFNLNDGEYALGIVSGVFETDLERMLYQPGTKNTSRETYRSELNIAKLREKQGLRHIRPHDRNAIRTPASLEERLETFLDSSRVLADGTILRTKLLVARIGDLRIEVYPKDHSPPHFHVVSRQRDIDARFDLKSLQLINTKRGRITTSDKKKIMYFFKTRPDMLEKLVSEHTRLNC